MDPALEEAVRRGDVAFLKNAISVHPCEYFLTENTENIFHLAARFSQVEFFREALERLPKNVTKELLFQGDDDGSTPLHFASWYTTKDKSHELVKLIINFYKSVVDDGSIIGKPWLAQDSLKLTPLHVALLQHHDEKCAMEILLMDVELLSSMLDVDGTNPLLYAVIYGHSQVAKTILTSPLSSFCVSDNYGRTPLHFAPNCSVDVLRLLLLKCSECIDKVDNKGLTVLHQWAEIGEASVWHCKLILDSGDFPEARRKLFKDLVCSLNNGSETPLHTVARRNNIELLRVLVRGYQQVMSVGVVKREIQEPGSLECPPWRIKNADGDTPLHTALILKNVQFAIEILSIDPTLCQICNKKGESPFFLAVRMDCDRVAEEILKIEEPRFFMLRRDDGTTVLHFLPYISENFARRLLEKYWWMINLADHSGRRPLEYAQVENTLWLVNLLSNPSLIEKEHFDWAGACKREDTQAVLTFIHHCPDLKQVCRQKKDTPLHHIKLPTYEDYVNFFQLPSISELKNMTDSNGATPLHRALERKDMLLAKTLLLDKGVDRIIADNDGRTAMDLLSNLCNENDDWENMCKQIKVNPHLRTSYVQHGTNLEQMRNTLSVVAALLATITFAAGFTLPGGINSNTGEAILARRPSFLVFLLTDVYAMCTSMLVLMCLMWSMVSEPDMSRLLVDRSVLILMQSLYSTLLAFMTGIFTVISHSSLWAAIVIFVMCLIIGISANRTILHNVIAKLVPAANREKKDPMRLFEEGSIGESSTGEDTSTEAVTRRRWFDYRWFRQLISNS